MNVTRETKPIYIETFLYSLNVILNNVIKMLYSVLDIFYILEYHARYVYFSIFQFLIKAFILIRYNNQYF